MSVAVLHCGGGGGGGGGFAQPVTYISFRRKKLVRDGGDGGRDGDGGLRLPSKRIAVVSIGAGRMNVVSWPFCVSPGAVCDQLVCASTVVHNDVVRLCTCSSKPFWDPSVLWYTTIVSTSMTSDQESVTLPLGYTCRLVDEPHSVSPLMSAEQSRDPLPQYGSTSD